ncbi:MAG: type II toxin-antitoxin system HicB family antitoxin [Betaproteobacteria bacterium]|nr:type II toxin-antitoxin system HicB family antitoxin [Betaproteobacteria bacterium]
MESDERRDRPLSYVVWDDNGTFVARCLDVEVVSDGKTDAAAVANLQEALDLYFEERGQALAEWPERTYRLGQLTRRYRSS